MTIEHIKTRKDGTKIVIIGGEQHEVLPSMPEWIREEVDQITFGSTIKTHRLCEEWTQEETAQKLNFTKQQLNAYELGKKLPSPRKAYEIAEQLGMFPEGVALIVINERLRKENLPFQVTIKKSA